MFRVVVILLLLMIACPASYASFKEATDAAEQGDYKTALKEFTLLSELGHAEAQFYLGSLYHHGVSTPKDIPKATKWLRLSALQGHPGAQFTIGYMYLTGMGVPKNIKEAVRWDRLSAEQGYPLAIKQLKKTYSENLDISETNPPIHECDRLAADPFDRNRVAKGVAKKDLDEGRAITACKDALNSVGKMPRFHFQLGRVLSKAGHHAKAMAQYKLAVKDDYAAAQNNIGYLHNRGYGVEKNQALATEWYKKAAKQGNAKGQYNLGLHYVLGLAPAEDFGVVIELFSESSKQGYSQAQSALGKLYRNGIGIEKNYEKALILVRQAAQKGDPKGAYILASMLNAGEGQERDYKASKKWFEMAFNKGHPIEYDTFELLVIFILFWLIHAVPFLFLFKSYEKKVSTGLIAAIFPSYIGFSGVLEDYGFFVAYEFSSLFLLIFAFVACYPFFYKLFNSKWQILETDKQNAGELVRLFPVLIGSNIRSLELIGLVFFSIPILGAFLAVFFAIKKYSIRRTGSYSSPSEKTFAQEINSITVLQTLLILPANDGTVTVSATNMGPSFKMTSVEAKENAHSIISSMALFKWVLVVVTPAILAAPLLLHPLTAIILLILSFSFFKLARKGVEKVFERKKSLKFPRQNHKPNWLLTAKVTALFTFSTSKKDRLYDWVVIGFFGILLWGTFSSTEGFASNIFLFYTLDAKFLELSSDDLMGFLGKWYSLAFFGLGFLVVLTQKISRAYYYIKLGRVVHPRDVIPQFDERLAILEN